MDVKKNIQNETDEIENKIKETKKIVENSILREDEKKYTSTVAMARYRIDKIIGLTRLKKKSYSEPGSFFHNGLKKTMKDKWGLSESSVKNYLTGRFCNQREQFTDYLCGVSVAFCMLDNIEYLYSDSINNEDFNKFFLSHWIENKSSILFNDDSKNDKNKSENQVKQKSERSIPTHDVTNFTTNNSFLKEIFLSLIFKKAFIVTFILCFVVNIVGCYISGTLIGDDPKRQYFFYDMASIINYVIICPIYVGLNVILIDRFIDSYCVSINYLDIYNLLKKNILWIAIILTISFLITTNYTKEILDPNTHFKIYWYISYYNSEELYLGLIGTYYIIINFILTIFISNSFIFFLKQFFFARNINISEIKNNNNTDSINQQLHSFVYEYFIFKFLIASYMANVCTWRMSQPHGSINYYIMIIFVTFLGLVIITIPRYYIQKQLYKIYKSNLLVFHTRFF